MSDTAGVLRGQQAFSVADEADAFDAHSSRIFQKRINHLGSDFLPVVLLELGVAVMDYDAGGDEVMMRPAFEVENW